MFALSIVDVLCPGAVIPVNGRFINSWMPIAQIEVIENTLDDENRAVFLAVATSISGTAKKLVNVMVNYGTTIHSPSIEISPVYTGDE